MFTFQYASIKPISFPKCNNNRNEFTFQYASIKPQSANLSVMFFSM